MQSTLKTRMIGAAVLIAIAVIVVPLFFSGKPSGGGGRSISLDIPQQPTEALKTRTLSVAAPSVTTPSAADTVGAGHVTISAAESADGVPAAAEPSNAATAARSASASASAPAQQAQASAAPQTDSTAEQAAAANKAAAEDQPGRVANARYRINLGAYAQKDNAKRLLAKVSQLGYDGKVSGVSIGGIPAARVYVGPFDSRARAETARLKLKSALPHAPAKLESVPTDQHGDAPAKALPNDQAGGWAVQVVAYDKRSDADDLRDRLRKAGFDGYVDDVKVHGNTLWRVRVGPLTRRSDALDALKRIKGKFPRLKGVVVAVP